MKVNRTIERAIQMMGIIAKNPNGLSFNEINEAMGIPKSSCFDILNSLVSLKMVENSYHEKKTFKIGVGAFVLGNQYTNNMHEVEIASHKIETVGEKYEKAAFVGKDSQEGVIYVHKYQPTTSTVIASCTVGTNNEYYNTALGKCILAFKADREVLVDEFYSKGVITDKQQFMDELDRIYLQRYAYSNQEHQKQLFCVSCPIFDHNGTVSLAISMSGLYSGAEICQRETQDLKEVAKSISRELGYVGVY